MLSHLSRVCSESGRLTRQSSERIKRALGAWRWVAGEICPSLASIVRNASTSGLPMSFGWRMAPLRPCQRMKNRAQYR